MAETNGKERGAAKSEQRRQAEPPMGQALRSVYQKAVEEPVPDELLDLLSRLD